MNSIQASMPLASYVMCWDDYSNRSYAMGSDLNVSGFMRHPWSIDRAKLAPH